MTPRHIAAELRDLTPRKRAAILVPWAADLHGLLPSERRVLRRIVIVTQDATFYGSIWRMAQELDMNVRTARRAMRRLEALGFIAPLSPYSRGGRAVQDGPAAENSTATRFTVAGLYAAWEAAGDNPPNSGATPELDGKPNSGATPELETQLGRHTRANSGVPSRNSGVRPDKGEEERKKKTRTAATAADAAPPPKAARRAAAGGLKAGLPAGLRTPERAGGDRTNPAEIWLEARGQMDAETRDGTALWVPEAIEEGGLVLSFPAYQADAAPLHKAGAIWALRQAGYAVELQTYPRGRAGENRLGAAAAAE